MNQQEREEKLQNYVRRLSSGEDLETVRKDFVANFQDVDPAEIMKAEQDLMKSGVDYRDVQRLCDVHSALFHGAAQQEKIASADGKARKAQAVNKMAMLSMMVGHPVNIFVRENEALAKKIKEIRGVLNDPMASPDDCRAKFEEIRPISFHYAKKGDLLYPLLKSRYGISGPSDVMWGVDDEIRDEVRALSRDGRDNLTEEDWRSRAEKVLTRAEEMIYKEQNILLPICVKSFSDTEWQQMARDIQAYEPCLTPGIPLWNEADRTQQNGAEQDGEVVLPTGHFTKEQLRAVLNTLPGEISFVDDKDINRYFNEGEKYFKRPLQALDREVYYCHPKKIEGMVRMMISQLRQGTKNSFDVWIEKAGHTFLVRYMAVRDENGKFLGTMEYVENMDAAKRHFGGSDAGQKPEW